MYKSEADAGVGGDMTAPKPSAEALEAAWDCYDRPNGCTTGAEHVEHIARALDAFAARAVAEERERIEDIMVGLLDDTYNTPAYPQVTAAREAIRARGGKS